MVYDGRWKYIRNRFDIDELYNLETDADEMQNLAAQPEHHERVGFDAPSNRPIWFAIPGPGPYDWCLSDVDGTTVAQ